MSKVLTEAGYEIQVLTHLPHYPKRVVFPGYEGKFVCHEATNFAKVLRIRPLIFKKQGFLWRFSGELWFAFWVTVFGVWGKRPRFVFATSPYMLCLLGGRCLASILRVPLVVELRDLTWLYASAINPKATKLSGYLGKFIVSIARSANGVTCANNSIRQYLIENGVRASTCITVSNGVDAKLLAAQEAVHSDRTGFHVMYVGLIGHAQALHVLVDVADRLKDDERYQITLVGDGPELKELQALSQERGLKNIHFVGGVEPDKLDTWYKQADILVVHLRADPAFDHALPSKVFEYMAAKKPVIFGGNGQGADLIREAEAGIVVTPEDVDALEKAIREIASHPEKALKFGQNGYNHVVTNYRREMILQKLVEFFDTI